MGSPEEELDLTNSHLHSLEGVTIPDGLKLVDLTANRLKSLDTRVISLCHLVRLNLRQNLLSDPSEIERLAGGPVLESLEIRDNEYRELPTLKGFARLRYLDASYNEIRSLAPLRDLSGVELRELYVAANKVSKIEGIDHLKGLEVVELGSNRITTVEGLATLSSLRELWLGRNRIVAMPDFSPFTSLRKLSLQSNRLTSMRGIERLPNLEELYLSHNGIEELSGISGLKKLAVLDISSNRIAKLGDLSGLESLTDLWANDNLIESLNEAEDTLRGIAGTLTCLYLSGNPASAVPSYKLRVKAALPKLDQLDGNLVA